ncbi:Ribosomal RNA large subunit methyltransferase K [Pontiella desulfatans]|uniref:Ribosomal RNA large subunit methyltransferase K n=1 Tax=Pontiella desulfatans TaxID=2750659 RepID=A0A6C2TVZ8_PONDE|nr:class I SAM-dependent methyltransferase [Pontiella desulfatans]VGO11511.1 Ribosomal RNA large subunit methyltransferase K [Pontiella desulfatans]
MNDQYELLDSGNGKKLERYGDIILDRPCAQAVWAPRNPGLWETATASFDRVGGLNWEGRSKVSKAWNVEIAGVVMKLSATDFGHIGVFPETRSLWQWIRSALREQAQTKGRELKFLNLFAYSGGATLAAAQAGAQCCHLDASKGMVEWARENAKLNGLQDAPIRWIVDDVIKFLRREVKRGNRYDGILLDPPSFGRGKKGELYKIEDQLMTTLDLVHEVLSEDPAFVLLTSHTPGFSPIVLGNLLRQYHQSGTFECGEMLLTGKPGVNELPNGNWACWINTFS